MADGNMGNLWFNLGIKDTTPQTLNRILRAVSDADGSVSKLRENFNKLLQGLKQEDAEALSKGFNKSVKNAMSYFEMLMRIENEQKRLASLKTVNNGINKQGLVEAENMLKTIKRDLLDLQHTKFGGVDAANLEPYAKALGNVIKNVKSIEDSFKKENSLSVAANNAERLKIKLEQVKNTLADIYSKQSSGMRGGFDTRWLLSAGNSLRGVQGRITRMLADDKLLLNESKFKSLISDIAYAMEKARGRVAEYNREREKTIAQEKKINDRVETQRKLDNGEIAYYARIRDILAQIDALNRSISTPLMNASRMGLTVSPSIGEDLRKLYSIKQILETNVAAGRNMGLDWLKNFLGRNGFSEITRELRQFSGNIDDARSKYERLFDILNRLRVERSRSNVLGIDTTKIDEDIARVIERLKLLRGIIQTGVGNVGDISGIDNRSVRLLERDASAQKRLNDEKERSNNLERRHQDELSRTGAKIQSQLVRGFKDANNAAGRLNSTVQDLKSLFMQGGLVFGAQQFAMNIIRTGGEMEKQHIAMQSILGDMQNANTMFNQTKELALQSPFTFSELNRDVKQLAAYGVEYENLYDTTKRLADMASGLGVSFERIALAFGQVQARGWLDGKELRQIAYAGIPLLDRLSKYYSQREGKKVTTSDVKGRITNREVSFQDVKNIFWEMTDAGGQFYNMQLTLSETLLGRYNKLKDAWEIMLADFARGDSLIGGTFKFILDTVTSIVQQMHTLGPVMAAAFTGFAIKRGITAMGGTKGTAFLNTKANIASDLQAKVMQGQQLSAIEQRILVTKNRITSEDLAALNASKALTIQDLNRLRIARQITEAQYRQYLGILRQQAGHTTLNMQMMRMLVTMRQMSFRNVFMNFASTATAAFGIVANGAKALGATLWSAIGGLPGLIITGVTMGISYIINKNAELKQSMTQTADELKDRYRQIGEFIRDNDVSKAIGSGDTKQIDNLIESYKDKFKELAPYDYDNLIMTSEEKKSHEERLKYLEKELEILQSANEVAQEKAGDSDTFSTMKNNMEKAKEAAETMLKARDKMLSFGATETDKTVYQDTEAVFNNTIETLKQFVASQFKGINNSPEIQAAYKQFRESMIAQIAPTEEAGNVIRAALDDSLGLSNGWLERRVLTEGYNLIEKVAGELALKIRSGKELNEAEKQKVKNLMESAANQLSLEYPMFANTLQDLLNQSDFIARIRLVYTPMGDIEKQVYNNIVPDSLTGDALKKAVDDYNILKPYLAGQTGFYEATNKVQQKLTSLWNEKKNRQRAYNQGKMSKELLDAATKEYEDLWNAAYNGLGYRYIPEDKKSNKTPKGSQEDEELKALRERIDAFKSFRQMYQKAKEVMPKDKAKDWAYGLFPEMKDLNPDDYIGSIEKLKKGFNFDLSKERQKALTSLNREIGDWKISEILKPEFEKAAANFKEALDKTMKQWDLWRTLMNKTGNENFANLAFTNGGIFDEQAKNLVRQFEIDYNMKFPGIYANDGDAKKSLEGIAGAYERWKAIADLVKNNYVKYLQDAADIIEKTASFEEKRAAVRARYGLLISTAEKVGDTQTATRYTIQRDKELGNVNLEEFKQSSSYLNFFGAVMAMTAEQAQETANKIKGTLLNALGEGSMDAREYAKQIDQVNGQLKAVFKGKKTFWNSGMQGVREQKLQDAYDEQTVASNTFDEAFRKYNEAMIEGNAEGMESAKIQMDAAKKQLEAAGKKVKEENKKGAFSESFVETVKKINSNVDSLVSIFNDIKETADLLGVDTTTDTWQDVSAAFESLQGISNSVSQAVMSAQSGNVMGILQGVVGIFTSPIKAFAKAHDAKMDRRIQQAERNIRAINNMSNNISTILEKILGGLYSYTNNADTVKMLKDMMQNNEKGSETYNAAQKALGSGNYFDTQYAALLAQKSEIQKQRDAEDRKKKTDQDAIAQYDQQLKELDIQIKAYAQDFLKEMYSIDFKSWASQLTDAIVEAWAKGENAADAYHDKVQELMKDLTKNILSQKIMEIALKPALDELEKALQSKGRLDETEIPKITDMLIKAGDNAVNNITDILDRLKEQGIDLSENGTLSVSNSIKSITEDTADLLASYVQAMRADLSVVRNMHERYYPQFSEIGNAQIIQMKAVAQNTLRNAEAAERIEIAVNSLDGNMKAVINGTKKFNIK